MWPFPKRSQVSPPVPPAAPDLPVSFGYKCAWYALASSDTNSIVSAVQLREARPSSWAHGIEQAYERSVFVSPPVKGWTFVVGFSLAPSSNDAKQKVRPRLESLSRSFGTALFFASHRVVELHLWAKAVTGSLARAYGYVGESGETFWNEGDMTAEERKLGFAFFDPGSAKAEEDGYWDREDLSFPDEQNVMDIAREWSVCPDDLEQLAQELGPSLGVLGSRSDALTLLDRTAAI